MTVPPQLAALVRQARTADILRVLDQALVRREPDPGRWVPGRV